MEYPVEVPFLLSINQAIEVLQYDKCLWEVVGDRSDIVGPELP